MTFACGIVHRKLLTPWGQNTFPANEGPRLRLHPRHHFVPAASFGGIAISVVEARWSVPDRWQEAVAERSCMTIDIPPSHTRVCRRMKREG